MSPIADRWSVVLSMFGSAVFLGSSLAAVIAGTLVGETDPLYSVVVLGAQQVLWGGLAGWHLFINLGLTRDAWPSPGETLLGAFVGFFLAAAGSGVTRLTGRAMSFFIGSQRVSVLYHREQALLKNVFRQASSPWLPLLLFGIVVIAVPVGEELFFRGYLYRVLKARFGRHALWATSLVFMVLHFLVVQGPAVFLMALGLNILYEKRGNLWVSVVAHAAINLLVAGFWLKG